MSYHQLPRWYMLLSDNRAGWAVRNRRRKFYDSGELYFKAFTQGFVVTESGENPGPVQHDPPGLEKFARPLPYTIQDVNATNPTTILLPFFSEPCHQGLACLCTRSRPGAPSPTIVLCSRFELNTSVILSRV